MLLFTDVNRNKKKYFTVFASNLWFDENCANVFIECRNLHCFFSFSLSFSFSLGFCFCCGHSKQSYASQNRWKQDEAITFTMPNSRRWVSIQLIWVSNENIEWKKTGSSERLATHLHNLRSFRFFGSFVRSFVPCLVGSTFFCCCCKKSCPKSKIDLICFLYNIVIFPFSVWTCALNVQSDFFPKRALWTYTQKGILITKSSSLNWKHAKCCWLNQMIDSFHLTTNSILSIISFFALLFATRIKKACFCFIPLFN